MIRYVVAVFVVLMLLNALTPHMSKMGLGRLPGDLKFRWLGRMWSLPLTSTLLMSALLSVLVKWLG